MLGFTKLGQCPVVSTVTVKSIALLETCSKESSSYCVTFFSSTLPVLSCSGTPNFPESRSSR